MTPGDLIYVPHGEGKQVAQVVWTAYAPLAATTIVGFRRWCPRLRRFAIHSEILDQSDVSLVPSTDRRARQIARTEGKAP